MSIELSTLIGIITFLVSVITIGIKLGAVNATVNRNTQDIAKLDKVYSDIQIKLDEINEKVTIITTKLALKE